MVRDDNAKMIEIKKHRFNSGVFYLLDLFDLLGPAVFFGLGAEADTVEKVEVTMAYAAEA